MTLPMTAKTHQTSLPTSAAPDQALPETTKKMTATTAVSAMSAVTDQDLTKAKKATSAMSATLDQ